MSRPFLKMNGLGNDFVVVEARSRRFAPSEAEARAIARRDGGIGFDHLIAIEPSPKADSFMRIWNADGGEVEQCGNAARCVGWLLMEASGRDAAKLDTPAGLLEVTKAGAKHVTVDMGKPGLDWRDIPLSEPQDTGHLDLSLGPLKDPVAVSMGNPHVVFFVDDVEAKARDRLRVRVWERGVGVTRACGTGACAALVAASRRNLCDRKAMVEMDGGDLVVEWRRSDDHVLMTGPVEVEFTGQLP